MIKIVVDLPDFMYKEQVICHSFPDTMTLREARKAAEAFYGDEAIALPASDMFTDEEISRKLFTPLP